MNVKHLTKEARKAYILILCSSRDPHHLASKTQHNTTKDSKAQTQPVSTQSSATYKTTSTMAPSREIAIGVPLYNFQALDVIGPMDVITTANYQNLVRFVSESEANRVEAPQVTFHYITPDDSTDPALSSGNVRIHGTTTFSTCPKLDFLLMGGPTPWFARDLPENWKNFITEKAKEVEVIFCTCTGALVLAATGLLDGVHATVNHMFVDFGKENFPAVKWDKGPNWVVSGGPQGQQIWTASGVGAGMDMMAQFCRENFGQPWLDYSTSLLEWQPRDINGTGMRFKNGRGEIVERSEIVV